MIDLSHKIILITGAGWKPGRSIALAFADQGARVLVNDLTPVNLDPIADEIHARGGKSEVYTADISGKIPAQTMITGILEKWDRIDILVNILGIKPKAPLLDLDEWDWRRAMDINLTGTFLMTQIVGRVIRETGGGSILYIADAAETNSVNSSPAAFETARSGLVGLTQSAARELGRYQIHVNALLQEAASNQLPLEALEVTDPLLNMATLAEAAVYLVSSGAKGPSGQVISLQN